MAQLAEPDTAAAREPTPATERPSRKPHPRRAGGAEPSSPRVSRTGGAVLLAAGAAIVIAVILVLVLSGGSTSKKPASAASRTTTPAASTPTTSGTTPQVVAQINLNPPSGGAAKGIAEVLRQQGKTGIAIVAQGLTPNSKKPPVSATRLS